MTDMLIRLFLLLLAIVATPIGAAAQGASVPFGGLSHDNAQPVEVSADALALDQATGTATFNGNVVAGQGALRISADELLVEYLTQDGAVTNTIRQMIAKGNVTLTNGGEAAEAQNAVYTVQSGSILMTGSVLLTQGPNALSGEKLRINLQTGEATIEGRVRTIFQPQGQAN